MAMAILNRRCYHSSHWGRINLLHRRRMELSSILDSSTKIAHAVSPSDSSAPHAATNPLEGVNRYSTREVQAAQFIGNQDFSWLEVKKAFT